MLRHYKTLINLEGVNLWFKQNINKIKLIMLDVELLWQLNRIKS